MVAKGVFRDCNAANIRVYCASRMRTSVGVARYLFRVAFFSLLENRYLLLRAL